jgi:membrane-associated protease RseP (regulator of RpoE activity)
MSVILAILGTAGYCLAAEPAANEENQHKTPATASSSESGQQMRPFLGIGLERVSPEMSSRIANLVSDGSGVMVAEVAEGSPAAKAGLKADDVIVKYDDQRLYAPEQFVKLVQNDKPNREIKLRVIHDDKAENLEVTLGERAAEHLAHNPANANGRQTRTAAKPETSGQNEDQLESFDELTLTRVDKNNFKAEIKYRDKNGKVETHNFQGTREQLRKDITGEKSLPSSERNQLLGSLSMSQNPLGLEIPAVEFVPEQGTQRNPKSTQQPAKKPESTK